MGSVPSFLLRKLYAKGSLKNTPGGFELAIRNIVAPATIVGLAPLRVDGVEYPLENTSAILPDGRQVAATEVSADRPLSFSVGDTVTVRVEGEPLAPGSHELIISPKTKEAGELDIFAQDTIS
jgi:hydroxymethylglutaryl-CoA reductase (NADPH)